MQVTRGRQMGFSLIEVLIASALTGAITMLCWGSFRSTFMAKSAIEAGGGRYRTVRLALERMTRDIQQAFLSQNEDSSQPERRTLFIGKRSNSFDELRFSYFGHQRLYADANEADSAQLWYGAMQDPRDKNAMNLIRRETRRLQYLKIDDNPGESDIICDNIRSLHFDYYDSRDKKWRDTWATTTIDGQPDRLPTRVKITLAVLDERGQEVPFVTEARVAMTEPLNLRAVDLVTK
jgi:general secretion pathway protein J